MQPYSCNEKRLDSIVQAICIFSKDIGMKFGIEKYAMLVRFRFKSVGIELPDGKVIKSLQEGESYLGILEADRSQGEEKLKDSKEYFRRLKIQWQQFSSSSKYLGSVPFKIFNSIYY